MRAKSIEQLLAGLPQLRPVLTKARQLAELQRLYLEIAPARLSRYSRVASLEGTTLVVFADSGAVGAKLKLLAPTLVKRFLSNAQQVTALRIEVQANNTPKSPLRPPIEVPPQAREQLSAVHLELPEGELKRAVESLLQRLR